MNPAQKAMEHAAAMLAAQRPSGAQFTARFVPPAAENAAAPWQLHLDALERWFADRWPEQVHFCAAYVENPRRIAWLIPEDLDRLEKEQISHLAPGYQRAEYLPRVPRVMAAHWAWGCKMNELLPVERWQAAATAALCACARAAAAQWNSTLAKPRLYWRCLPVVITDYDPVYNEHRVVLRFRCALEGSYNAAGNCADGMAVPFIVMQP